MTKFELNVWKTFLDYDSCFHKYTVLLYHAVQVKMEYMKYIICKSITIMIFDISHGPIRSHDHFYNV